MCQDKKTLIYEAALSLVDENLDLSSIKVADIAERANIGKGTVYEYFDSKEQVIGEAIIFMFNRDIKALEQFIGESTSFREGYLFLLRNLSVLLAKNRNLFNFMAINHKNLAIHTAITAIVHARLEELRQAYLQIIEKLVDKSVQEGIIKEKPAKYDWHTAVLSSMFYVAVYKQFTEDFGPLTDEQVLEKAYNAYVKLLQ